MLSLTFYNKIIFAQLIPNNFKPVPFRNENNNSCAK